MSKLKKEKKVRFMYNEGKRHNIIILIIVGLLFLLLMIITTMLQLIKNQENTSNTVAVNVVTNQISTKREKTVQEILELNGTKLIKYEKDVLVNIYVNFKYDLFDIDGKSRKQYFYNMIEELVETEKTTFYLIDNEKNIKILVKYDKETQKHTIVINNVENYYDQTNGEIYASLNKVEVAQKSDFVITNTTISTIANNNMYYTGTNTVFTDFDSRVDLGNGYYSYKEGTMLAKLQSGRIINLILTKDFDEEIRKNIYVTTPLEEIYEKYDNPAFGGLNEGFLAYRTRNSYIFFYEEEVSIYASQYEEKEEFDEYLSEYCNTGNLEQLYSDFSRNWGNYYEIEYNPELQKLKLSYPSRGIEIDIEGNDSRGIKIYNNYYLTETVKSLIEDHKITLIEDKNLVFVVEQARRENSR